LPDSFDSGKIDSIFLQPREPFMRHFDRFALLALALFVAAPAHAKTVAAPARAKATALAVPFHENDYDAALAEARAKNVPLFVDAWATWCHTCRSMKAFVLTDTSLKPRSDQFVWFSMDVENPKNAALKDKFPTNALPTFYVVNSKDESVAKRWVGGMTIAQLQGFLTDGQTTIAGGETGNGEKIAEADLLYGKADYKAAGDAYLAAWPTLETDNKEYARIAEATLYSLSTTERNADVIALAEKAQPVLGETTSGASMAVSALGAAIALPADAPGRAETIAKYERLTREYLASTKITLADDDRSGMLSTLMEARSDAKDEAGAKAAAQAWSTFLDQAAAKATTADGRAVFDSHRLAAYIEIGKPELAVPMLEASEKALPDDYNPPARLAVAYNAMKRCDDALAATDRALAKAYGPRKLRSYQVRSDAFAGKGDMAAARRTMDEAIAYASSLPEGQKSDATIASLTKKRDGIAATATPTANAGK
jgi:thioredoxin-like negative regulator of GroEL